MFASVVGGSPSTALALGAPLGESSTNHPFVGWLAANVLDELILEALGVRRYNPWILVAIT